MATTSFDAATAAQLKAEITAAGMSMRSMAAALDEDYTTFYRWATGQRPIKLITVYAILDHIGLDIGTFFTRVQERAGSGR
jgi:transcriptional regulator with XRE-family HTH domain